MALSASSKASGLPMATEAHFFTFVLAN